MVGFDWYNLIEILLYVFTKNGHIIAHNHQVLFTVVVFRVIFPIMFDCVFEPANGIYICRHFIVPTVFFGQKHPPQFFEICLIPMLETAECMFATRFMVYVSFCGFVMMFVVMSTLVLCCHIQYMTKFITSGL
jgi:hypothetical protein